MDDVRRMNIKTASEQLVHEVLNMIVRKILARVDYSMHVGLHQVSYNVDVLESCGSWWLCYVDKADNVFMVEELYPVVNLMKTY